MRYETSAFAATGGTRAPDVMHGMGTFTLAAAETESSVTRLLEQALTAAETGAVALWEVGVDIIVLGVLSLFWIALSGREGLDALNDAASPLVVLAVISGMAGLVGGSLNSLVAAAPRYQERVDDLLSSSTTWLEGHGIEISYSQVRHLVDPSAAIGLGAAAMALAFPPPPRREMPSLAAA